MTFGSCPLFVSRIKEIQSTEEVERLLKNRIRKFVMISLIIVFAAIFAFSLYMIISQLTEERKSAERFDELMQVVRGIEAQMEDDASDTDEQTEPETDAQSGQTVLAQYSPLYEQNGDLFGWIRIEDTPIDYPVMYTPEDPERYLRRDFDGNYSVSGVPFVDGECVDGGNYYIIYGHHMKNNAMFGTLPYYKDKSYWEEHRIIHFDTLYEKREYEIFAAFYSKVYDSSDQTAFKYYLYHDLTSQEVFEEYVRRVKVSSIYDTGAAVEYGDELLALSTCNYHTDNGRFVVVAKRIK